MKPTTAKRYRRWLRDRALQIVTASPGLTKAVVRRAGSPSLAELSAGAETWHTTAPSFLASLPESSESWNRIMAMAESVVEPIIERSASISLRYPSHYAVERETCLLLYAIVRVLRPEVVLETGVADGLSSAVILEALGANGRGELHSVDVADDVGSLIRERSAWRLHVVSENSLADDLRRIAGTVAPVDLFLHDANHDYRHQMLEYTTFWPTMAPGGMFLSDDVDWSYAFLDFAREVNRVPTMLLDSRKVVGMIRC